jgi:hypothetical protein
LGVTPSAWGSGNKAIQTANASFWGSTSLTAYASVGSNYFLSGSGYTYINSATAADYYQLDGSHVWRTAASGTAGNAISFTQAMTLDASGNLGVGTTSPTTLVDLVRSSTSGSDVSMPNLFVRNTSGTQGNGSSTFNQAVSLVSAGNGTVAGGIRAAYDSAGSYGTGMQLFVNSTNPLQFYTNGAERARIDSSGNLLVNASSSTASTGQTAKLQVAGGIRATSGFTSSISLGTIAQNATTTAAVGFGGVWLISNGGDTFALINITLSGGGTGTLLIFSTGGTNIVCGSTSEPSGGGYLRLWISGGVLQVKNVNEYTGPWFLTPLATFGS